MICPDCQSKKVSMKSVRDIAGATRRTYGCLNCKSKFFSYELTPTVHNPKGSNFNQIMQARQIITEPTSWGKR